MGIINYIDTNAIQLYVFRYPARAATTIIIILATTAITTIIKYLSLHFTLLSTYNTNVVAQRLAWI